MMHSFDVELACKYGMLEAVLLYYFDFWIEKNKANEKHFHDGYYWTYNSNKAFTELFPYASQKRIRTALSHLIEEGLIATGNYNEKAFDHTTWYRFTEKGISELPCRANRFAQEGKPIPVNNNKSTTSNNNNSNNNSNNSNNTLNSLNSLRDMDNNFDIFWSSYPKKKNKGQARRVFPKAIAKTTIDVMVDAIEKQKHTKDWQRKGGQFIPYPSTWLNAEGWENEVTEDEIQEVLPF